jgi:hypothetical protein
LNDHQKSLQENSWLLPERLNPSSVEYVAAHVAWPPRHMLDPERPRSPRGLFSCQSDTILPNRNRCAVQADFEAKAAALAKAAHKLDVQFSRIQLSRRRHPLSRDGRDQCDKIDKPELAVELAQWQRFPAAAAPLAEPMRPNSPHQPAVESVEELSDVSPLITLSSSRRGS